MRMIRTSAPPDFRQSYGSFSLLRDLVHERTGLNFEDEKRDIFLDKLLPLVVERGFDSLLDYYYLLKNDSESAYEWRKVLDALTVQESYFWREMDHIRALVDEIVPQYFSARPDHTLNIWSAACAAGEEPLTIAMALHEAGWFDRARINIHASDASTRAVEAAQNGIYRERSFRSLPPDLREKYFACADAGDGGLSQVSRKLHSRVRWEIANLMSEPRLALAAMTSDVIFCRNVFIYFSESAARKTVRVFAERMPRPGYLFVGTAESLLKLTSDFELREIGDAYAYVRN
jgi:chemotaxis protein methyltransferase CheR